MIKARWWSNSWGTVGHAYIYRSFLFVQAKKVQKQGKFKASPFFSNKTYLFQVYKARVKVLKIYTPSITKGCNSYFLMN